MHNDFIDTVSFIIGLANYRENLTQSDKAEIMDKLDKQTNDILMDVKLELSKQNEMLTEILSLLKEGKNDRV